MWHKLVYNYYPFDDSKINAGLILNLFKQPVLLSHRVLDTITLFPEPGNSIVRVEKTPLV